MSFEAMTWAVKVLEDHPTWKAPVRFVLLIMANRADEEGVLYPSVRWIMQRTALSESAVRTATRQIQKAGLLIKEKQQRDDGGQSSNLYRLAMSQYVLKLFYPGAPETGGGVRNAPPHAPDAGEGVHTTQAPGALGAPVDTKGLNKRKKGTPRPGEDYAPSSEMIGWVREQGYEPYLRLHLEKFRNACATQRRKPYDNLDAAFKNCVLDDWGRVRFQAQMAARRGEGPAGAPITPPNHWSLKPCRYCPKKSTGIVNGIVHCDEHRSSAMDQEPAPHRMAA